MLKKQSLFYVLFLFFIVLSSSAQNATIKGVVVNDQNNQALEYASIALLNTKDSTVAAGTISKQNGSFILSKINAGNYIVKVVFIGYETKYISNVSVETDGQINLNNIVLKPGSKFLNDVIVTGKKATNTNKIDKQTYRSEQFESAKGGSAVDVLKNLPSVTVNGQGDISVRGSTGFLVLVNGKPVLTDAQTVLSQLPANAIENIELITAPSAKYDPDGKGGIINIITKKGTTDGIGLVANVQGGLPTTTDYNNLKNPVRFGADATITIKQKNWDISIGGNYQRNDVNGRRDGDVFTKDFINNTITRFPSSGERSFDKYNYGGRTTIIYTPNKTNAFTIGFFAGKKFQTRRADILYQNSTADLITNTTLRQFTYFNSNLQTKQGNFLLGSFDYTHTFKNKSTITASALIERARLTGNTSNKNFNYPAKDFIYQEVYNPYSNPIDGYRFKLDHTTVLGTGKLESGYQFRYDKQNGQFDYIVTPAVSQPDASRFKGTVKAKNTINSIYTQYTGKANKLQYVAGLRYEYANREVNLSYEAKPYKLNFSNLFPTANFLYSFNNHWNAKAGYSKRVQRNNNFELNPIPEREHSETLEQGDPNLLPQFVDLAEIGLNHNYKTGNFFATLYFQNIKNPIQRVNSVYADTILNRLFTNAERARLAGLELGSTIKPVKWFTLYLGANIYHYSIDGALNVLGSVSTVDNSNWVYSINTNTTFDLGKQWSIQANVNYTSAKPTAQGEDSRFLVPNTSVKKTFANGRCSIGLQWQNMNMGFLNANQQRITTFGSNFYTTTNYIYETDVFMLNFSFNFNKLTNKAKLPSSEIGEKEF
jgi:ferric enterobactin receptor